MKKIFASVMLASLLMVSNSFGAEIKVEKWKNGLNAITVVGDITTGDNDRFRKIAIGINEGNTVVLLNSNGGTVIDALAIGKAIKVMGYSTYVSNSDSCNSSCAFIWLAGSKRFLDRDSKVGFHAAYIKNNGVDQETGVGNAIVGNYLSSLNLSENAIIYITSAPPSSLNWITVNNASSYGIDVTVIDDKGSENKPTSTNSDMQPIVDNVDGWKIGVDQTLKNGCFALANYDDFVFRMGYDDERKIYIIMAGTKWSINDGQKYQMDIVLDKNSPWSGNFTVASMTNLKILTGYSNIDFLSEFSTSSQMRIMYNNRSIEFVNIPSAKKVVEKLKSCQVDQDKDPFH